MPGGITREEFLRRQTSMTACSYKCDEAVASRFRVRSGKGGKWFGVERGREEVTFRACGELAVGLVDGHPRCAAHGGVEA